MEYFKRKLGENKKSAVPTNQDEAQLHSVVPPEISAQSQHSDRLITVPVRIGL